MKTILRGGFVVSGRTSRRADVLIDGGKIEKVGHVLLDAPKDAPLADIPGTVPPPTDWPKGCAFHPRCPKARTECGSDDFNILWEKAGRPSTRCIA